MGILIPQWNDGDVEAQQIAWAWLERVLLDDNKLERFVIALQLEGGDCRVAQRFAGEDELHEDTVIGPCLQYILEHGFAGATGTQWYHLQERPELLLCLARQVRQPPSGSRWEELIARSESQKPRQIRPAGYRTLIRVLRRL